MKQPRKVAPMGKQTTFVGVWGSCVVPDPSSQFSMLLTAGQRFGTEI